MTVAATATKSGHVAIIVHLAGAATVEGVVCNLAGRTVAALPACALPEGRSTLFWNSRATSGLAAPAGTYLLRLKARGSDGGQTQSVASVSLRR
jgi:hypothetical protein